MTKTKAKKSKPKYSTCVNTIYLLKNIWRLDKLLFSLCFLQIPVTVIIPLLGIYIPKIVIDSAAKHVSANQLLFNVGMPILVIIVLNVLLNVSASITNLRAISYRARTAQLLTNKVLDTDFENIDGVAGQEKIEKAVIGSQSSDMNAIIKVSVDLFSNIIGFILYAGIISTIHPLIVIFLIITSVINYFMGKYVSDFEHRNKDNLVPIERKLRYIMNKTGEFKSAKDMRLYNMVPYLYY